MNRDPIYVIITIKSGMPDIRVGTESKPLTTGTRGIKRINQARPVVTDMLKRKAVCTVVTNRIMGLKVWAGRYCNVGCCPATESYKGITSFSHFHIFSPSSQTDPFSHTGPEIPGIDHKIPGVDLGALDDEWCGSPGKGMFSE